FATRGSSRPASHQRSSSARLRLIRAGSRSACAPQTTPMTEMFLTRIRLAGTAWMRPAAKPITSIRASQLTVRSAWSNASPPTGSQMAAMGQREMRGAVGNRKGGSPDEIHRIGDRHHRGGGEHDLLGIAAAVAQHRERPLPDPQAIDRAACLDNLAGGFEPRGERELRLHLIGAADHQAVGEVDARGADPEPYLVLLEVRALGLFEPQHIGSAPFPATDRLHF